MHWTLNPGIAGSSPVKDVNVFLPKKEATTYGTLVTVKWLLLYIFLIPNLEI